MTQAGLAAQAVGGGGLIVLPTDTVYGIGCTPFSKAAVRRLLATKGRGETMPPPVLGADAETLFSLAKFQDQNQERVARRLAETFWPGPLTLIIPLGADLGWDASMVGDTVAVRVPGLEQALNILRETGPLAVTSANPTGRDPALTIHDARNYFREKVSAYFDAGPSKGARPSTIVDVTRATLGVPAILRVGDVTGEAIAGALDGKL